MMETGGERERVCGSGKYMLTVRFDDDAYICIYIYIYIYIYI